MRVGFQGGRRRTNREGAAAVEFALVGPILVLLLIGIVVYGGWFWMAHSVQSLASEGARAAVAGLDAEERENLARARVDSDVRQQSSLDPALTTVDVQTDEDGVAVVVRYDARQHPIMLLGGMLPKPPAIIERSAVIRAGGY